MLFAILGFAVAPFLKRRVRRFGRAIDIFGVPAPGASEHTVGGGVERFKSFAARAFDPLAIDVMLHGGAREFGTNLIDKLLADAGRWGYRGHDLDYRDLYYRLASALGSGRRRRIRGVSCARLRFLFFQKRTQLRGAS